MSAHHERYGVPEPETQTQEPADGSEILYSLLLRYNELLYITVLEYRDTDRTEESFREVSSFQGLNCTYAFGERVSLIERCPYFRGVLREGFHCI